MKYQGTTNAEQRHQCYSCNKQFESIRIMLDHLQSLCHREVNNFLDIYMSTENLNILYFLDVNN